MAFGKMIVIITYYRGPVFIVPPGAKELGLNLRRQWFQLLSTFIV
jgi:hypothetical protein